jgi:hypothetical protein
MDFSLFGWLFSEAAGVGIDAMRDKAAEQRARVAAVAECKATDSPELRDRYCNIKAPGTYQSQACVAKLTCEVPSDYSRWLRAGK